VNDVKALTVRQPWAWAIVAGYKDVENRPRRTNYRGHLFIHAGAALDPKGFEFLWKVGLYRALPTILPLGGLIGRIQIVDCIKGSESEWALPGSWHWILRKPREFKNVLPCRGYLGMFKPEVSARSLGQALRHSTGHRQAWLEAPHS
jgi:hypothetical protein